MNTRTSNIGRRFRYVDLVILMGSLIAACNWTRTSVADDLALIVDAQAEVVVFDNVVLAPAGDPQLQQFRAQFEPLLKVELSFANRACKLSDDQRRKLIAKSNDWLDEYIRDSAKQGGQPQVNGGWFRNGAQPQMADPRKSIQEGVEKLIKAELPEEQAKTYVEESVKRDAFQRKVAVDNLVARIDGELNLAPEQREKLAKSLTEHWDKSWAPQLEMFVHGMDVWPNVPHQWVCPHLTATQQAAWGKLQKHSGPIFFGAMGMEGQVIDDIDLKEGKEKAAGEVEPKAVPAINVYQPL